MSLLKLLVDSILGGDNQTVTYVTMVCGTVSLGLAVIFMGIVSRIKSLIRYILRRL